MTDAAKFWDNIAASYAAKPVGNEDAYAATLARVRSYLTPSDTVLEVGCGTGTTALKLAPFVSHITATDFAPAMIEIARGKADAGGVTNASFSAERAEAAGSGAYDAVLGFNLLHLVEDLPGTIAALKSHLRPGGLLITKSVCLGGIYSPIALLIFAMRLMGKAPHVGLFTPGALQRMIAEQGFEILETGNYPARPPSHLVVARRL